jgi:HK97 family phage portal protein
MFLSIRAEAGSDGDRSPWSSFWFEPVPYRHNGPVTPDTAMQLTAVYSCVRVLAESVACLPFVLQRESDDGAKTKVKDHWLYRLLAKRPNNWQNPFEFREMMQGHAALRGNAYSVIVGNPSGEVTDLLPVNPNRVRVEMLSDINYRYQIKNRDGTETPVNREGMFHLRGLSGDGIVGYNPIEAARRSISAGLAAQDYGMRFFQNDARPGGWIEYPGQFKDDEQRRKFRESWQAQQAGANRSKTGILEYGMKFHEVGITNEDSQFIETRKFSIAEIARLFRIPPHMIGDLEKATFSNIEQQSLEFVIHTLTPWLVRWEQAIESTFLDPEEELGVEFPTLSLLRGDAAARATYYHNGILDGWLTRNEARLAENRNPLAGLDEPLRPLNMVEENDAQQTTDDTEPAVPPTLPRPSRVSPPDSRLVALALSSAKRVARKEMVMTQMAFATKHNVADALTTAYAKHAEFVAAALSVPRKAAEYYCIKQCDLMQTVGQTMLTEEFLLITEARLERLALGLPLLEESCDTHS